MNRMLLLLLFAGGTAAQNYEIPSKVVAGGGGTAQGASFAVTGTIGQNASAPVAEGGALLLYPGFWHPVLSPTAAEVVVTGRVIGIRGEPVSRALISAVGMNGERRTATTNTFGRFRITGLAPGFTYVIEVGHRRYLFSPFVVSITDDLNDLEFIAIEGH